MFILYNATQYKSYWEIGEWGIVARQMTPPPPGLCPKMCGKVRIPICVMYA